MVIAPEIRKEAERLEERLKEQSMRLNEAYTPLTFPELLIVAEKTLEIERLKREKNAIVLAHNYQGPIIKYGIADFVGDSLELSQKAASVDAAIIVFCGVGFMADTAKILNPQAKVLLPDRAASCSLVDGFSYAGKTYEGLTAEDVRKFKELFPGLPVVTYINSTAEVKAETDVCCTSGNVETIMQKLGEKVIFLPDANMARNICVENGRALVIRLADNLYEITEFTRTGVDDEKVVSHTYGVDYETAKTYVAQNKVVVGKNSKCMVHEQFTPGMIDSIRAEHPGIEVLSHLECPGDVVQGSDYNGSTSGMLRFIRDSKARIFFMITECNMYSTLKKEFPDREFYTPCVICPHMGKITLDKTLEALRTEQPEILISQETSIRARNALDNMYQLMKA